jgi:hypothetical protein
MNRRFYPALLVYALLAALSSCTTNPSASPIDGTWDFTMSSPFGAVNATVTLAAAGDTLTGTFDLGEGRIWQIENGTVNGNTISFRIDRDGSPMVYDMTATIEADNASGSASAMGTEVPWEMTRRS